MEYGISGEASAFEIGRTGEMCAAEDGISGAVGTSEVEGSFEMCASEMGIDKVGAFETGMAGEVDVSEVGGFEMGTVEVGMSCENLRLKKDSMVAVCS